MDVQTSEIGSKSLSGTGSCRNQTGLDDRGRHCRTRAKTTSPLTASKAAGVISLASGVALSHSTRM